MPVPKPRAEVFDLYWYFAAERQRIFERRIAGSPGPWTDDPTLRRFKFCNVFRAADRVSQFLIRDVAYCDEPQTPQDRVFQIFVFRIFSRIETWRALCHYFGRAPIIDDLRDGSFQAALEAARARNGGLYTGAFILCATPAFGHKEKHLNHVDLFRHMFIEDAAAEKLLAAPSLSELYDRLRTYPLIGNFMAYQIAIDLNYSPEFAFDENDFTSPGPGALRGIRKAFSDLGGLRPRDAVLWVVEHQDEEFERTGLDFRGLFGRPLHAIDCQGLFCELDKYCREAMPELRSARSRIKATFSESAEPLRLFFPPKWEINERTPQRPVLGDSGGSVSSQH